MSDYLNLKTANCKNCYKCIRHCPVKSIRFENNHAQIITEECILCGNCFVVCPQKAKEIRNDTEKAESLIQSGAKVYASIAPSFPANYVNPQTGQGYSLSALARALEKLGFAGAEETARGAAIVKRQYERMVDAARQDVIISSCCHSINQLIQKYYPEVLPAVAKVMSPMQAHCMDIKRRFRDARTVFIGPCISKKAEAETYGGFADCVLTFNELSDWLSRSGIRLEETEEEDCDQGLTRFFPVAGGILRSMRKLNPDYSYICVDGIENCVAAIGDIAGGKLKKCFIEMSACAGSCSGGPVMEKRLMPVRNYIAIANYARERDFDTEDYPEEILSKDISSLRKPYIHLGDSAILEVLRKIGKTKPEQELNCGTCGYNTCRDKARAVLEGKANLFMCLPYLIEKAESFSDDIIKNTPNGVIVLNEMMEVQQINAAACKMLNITPSHILGDQVVRIMDPDPFLEAVEEAKNTYDKIVYLPEYEKYVSQTVLYDKTYHIIICIMRDVTEETRRVKSNEDFTRQAIEITDKVIEKQMRSVQEIASLLGETTAETKIALTKLKESILYEERQQ
ncbi:MAG: 4Fe-4S dicluster domain-containing protein [Spirochaetales bacterium]|jgi:iron only hydrogenase large subunit-like protein/uncharacterized Fe-S cluster-containing protein|nr:4Fe-4S dicluster domain-containing protein [Spirochaetales bacterium]